MSRWQAGEPRQWCGAWEGRAQTTDSHATRTAACGHLHRSAAEAERCAHGLAARLNSPAMPPGYYLG
jgi:hypothetical protein